MPMYIVLLIQHRGCQGWRLSMRSNKDFHYTMYLTKYRWVKAMRLCVSSACASALEAMTRFGDLQVESENSINCWTPDQATSVVFQFTFFDLDKRKK